MVGPALTGHASEVVSMKQMLLLAFVSVVAAGSIAYALLVVSREVRQVARGLDTLNHEVDAVAQDVNSIADDVNAIADAMAGEPETGEAALPLVPFREGKPTSPMRTHATARRRLARPVVARQILRPQEFDRTRCLERAE